MDKPKQIIVMRKDLNMRKGKMVAQGAHASLAAVLSCGQRDASEGDCIVIEKYTKGTPLQKLRETRHPMKEWIEGQFTKICVSVNSEEELVAVINKARDAGLIHSLITDAGHTEFNGVPTITCGAVGPAYPDQLKDITGDLPLL
ncbi:MAG TPA: aminoacyl-tRNA hydrolase [Methanosarcina sp.]|nr:aminoacyl-tRNA hydrolase [Methanosarcina sp.]